MKKIAIITIFISLVMSICSANEVNVFSARHYDSDIQLYEKFTKKTGIKVNVVSGKDKALQNVFKSGGDLHSTVAKMVFQLPHDAADISVYAKKERQAAKAITFGIMYGSGPAKVSETVTQDSGELFSIEQVRWTQTRSLLRTLKEFLTNLRLN